MASKDDNKEEANSKSSNIDFVSGNWNGEITLVNPVRSLSINAEALDIKNIA